MLGITVLSRSESETRHAYFELFRTFQDTFVARKQIYENVLLFVPYAILLFGLAEFFRNGWLMMGIGLISSFAIEATQWITHAGYFEIDDIWTNVVGMMLGYVLCVIVRLVIRSCRR
ncbi:MAG: VanZ family protein [Roseburia sp.]|nr:VanZ family protein [Roseburia sp.]